jgi:Protein of unknown function (DUF4236)
MALFFRKTKKVAPGVSLNVSKRGVASQSGQQE